MMRLPSRLTVLSLIFFTSGTISAADIPLADSTMDTLFFKPWNSSTNGLICNGPPHSYPKTFCVDGEGSVWIPDGLNGNLLKKFAPDGTLLQVYSNRAASSVLDCGTDRSNHLYVLSGDTTARLGCQVQKEGEGRALWIYKNLIFASPIFSVSQSGFLFLFERLDDGNGTVKMLDGSGKAVGILPSGFYAWLGQHRLLMLNPKVSKTGTKKMALNIYTNTGFLPEEKAIKKRKWKIFQRSSLNQTTVERFYSTQWRRPMQTVDIPQITDTMISPLGVDAYGSFFGLFRIPLTDRYYVLRINANGKAVRIPIERLSLVMNRPVCIDKYGQVYEMVFEQMGMKVVRWSPVK